MKNFLKLKHCSHYFKNVFFYFLKKLTFYFKCRLKLLKLCTTKYLDFLFLNFRNKIIPFSFEIKLANCFILNWRREPWRSGLSCLLGQSEIAGSNPALAYKFQRNKMFLPCSLVKIQYCWESP